MKSRIQCTSGQNDRNHHIWRYIRYYISIYPFADTMAACRKTRLQEILHRFLWEKPHAKIRSSMLMHSLNNYFAAYARGRLSTLSTALSTTPDFPGKSNVYKMCFSVVACRIFLEYAECAMQAHATIACKFEKINFIVNNLLISQSYGGATKRLTSRASRHGAENMA